MAFALAATALLGSPGPGIAALVAVGRSFKRRDALTFLGAMQAGLAIAAALSVLGLASLVHGVPTVRWTVMVLATAYLIWLAWKIASAPITTGAIGDVDSGSLTNKGAFFLGVANPKAYLAFASLFGSFVVVRQASELTDAAGKWLISVLVMIVVDLAWLLLGMALGRIDLAPRHARGFNRLMGLTILAACLMTWL